MRKHLFSFICLAFLTLGATNLFAASYELRVRGTQVTDSNKDNVLGDGKVSYDPTAKRLSLKNASILNSTGNGIDNRGIEDLIIWLEGKNQVLSSTQHGIYSEKNFTIAAVDTTHTLVVSSGAGSGVWCGICANNCRLTLRKTTIAAGGVYGISGMAGANSTLTIDNAAVAAKGNGNISVGRFTSITLKDCKITSPSGAKVSNGTVVTSGGSAITNQMVTIEPPRVHYELWIGGVRVHEYNCDNITAAVNAAGKGSSASGTITYNPTTKTLTLNGANISTNSEHCIDSGIDGLKIVSTGANTLNSLHNSGVVVDSHSCTVMGGGTLAIDTYSGFYVYDECSLTIENTNITAKGRNRGITGNNCSVEIKNSTVKATGTEFGSIHDIKSLTLKGCEIISPSGAVFSDGAVKLNGAVVKTEVVIAPLQYYDLWVEDVQVSNANASDVLGDGKVSYNAKTSTLTLNGATVQHSSPTGVSLRIGSDCDNVKLIGENECGIIWCENNCVISGIGSLYCTDIIAVANTSKLTILNTTVVTEQEISGDQGDEALEIDNSNVTVKKGGIGSLAITLTDCDIIKPSGAVNTGRYIELDNKTVTSEIVISTTGTSYYIWVGGVQVTDANKANILAGTANDGKVSYNSSSNTLTLNGANITSDGAYCIENHRLNLTIELKSTNTMEHSSGCISSREDFTINGGGSLDIYSYFSVDPGIWANYCNLTIENVIISVRGGWGITGDQGKNEILTIRNATVRATGKKGSIVDFKKIILEDCNIISPVGALIMNGNVKLNNETVTTEVMIEANSAKYNLWVGGTQVTTTNRSDVLSDGNVSYDPVTKTLTLNGATVQHSNPTGVSLRIGSDCDTVKLIGENTCGIIWCENDCVITGGGSLYCTDIIAVANTSKLTILNTTVVTEQEISGDQGDEALEIDNSNVTVKKGGIGSLAITLTNCEIIKPSGAVNTGHYIELDNKTVTSEIVIQPTAAVTEYGLLVEDVRVTSANASDVLGDGKVSYDAETKTLTLNGANLRYADEMIRNDIEGLKIELKGTNTIEYYEVGIKSVEADLSIVGTGNLTILSSNASVGIDAEGLLTIEGVTLTAEGLSAGIRSSYLIIKNATVKAKGTNKGSIIAFNEITLDGCEIIKPTGAVIDGGTIKLNGNVVTEEVVIASTTAVPSVQNDNVKIFARDGRIFGAENAHIYDILGRDVTKDNGNLKGVFVVKGDSFVEKIIVR